MSPHKPTMSGGPDLRHTGYSVAIGHNATDFYMQRERITSRSTSIDGKVFYPQITEGKMEAIVVDFAKDEKLREYIEKIEVELEKKMLELKAQGRPPTLEMLLALVTYKVAYDFPYAHRMLDKLATHKVYVPGKKYLLGAFMIQQNMVCRHMGLLVAAILEHMKAKGKIQKNRKIRFAADQQQDLLENQSGGHAYVVVIDREKTPSEYYVSDPAGGNALGLRGFVDKQRLSSPIAYRYLFSTLRVLFQEPDQRDHGFLVALFKKSKSDSNLAGTLKDVEATFTKIGDITASRYFTEMRTLAT